MKKLFLIRHAKSSWNDFSLSDYDRPLNSRGIHDAPKMAAFLQQTAGKIDAIYTSPAVRALSTAQYFRDAFGIAQADFHEVRHLYHASISDFYNVLQKIPDNCHSVMIFSHNPGITEFSILEASYELDNVPTCGILDMDINIETWAEFDGSFIVKTKLYTPESIGIKQL
jgi:phosphohistidine phosphatase